MLKIMGLKIVISSEICILNTGSSKKRYISRQMLKMNTNKRWAKEVGFKKGSERQIDP